jgi:Gpi18-like mannosyltransferase
MRDFESPRDSVVIGSQPPLTSSFWPYGVLVVIATAVRWLLLPRVSGDLENFVIGWYEQVANRGLPALTGEFANYNVPYLYALFVPARLLDISDPVVGIKIVSTVFDCLLAWAGATTVAAATGDRSWSAWGRSAAVIYSLPTVVMNSAWWGQCDAGYAAFSLFAVAAAAQRRGVRCASMWGLSVSLKMQACFVLPALGALSLFGWMPLWPWLLAPLVYLASLMPAWTLGRPLGDLLSIYSRQGQTFSLLSASAPNPWTIVPEKLVTPKQFRFAVTAGLLLATAVGVRLLQRVRESVAKATPFFVVQLAFLSAFIFPFVLPKMHDRYFYLADILSVTLALVDRRFVWVALAVQMGSASAYMPFLIGAWQPLLVGMVTNGVVALSVIRWMFPRAFGQLTKRHALRPLNCFIH